MWLKTRVFFLLSDNKEEREETDEDSDDDEEEDDEEEDDDDTEVKEENGVLVLNDKNYETFMEGKDTVLIEFYAPWYVCHSSACQTFHCSKAVLKVFANFSIFLHPDFVFFFKGVATASSLPQSMKKSLRPLKRTTLLYLWLK